MKKGKMEFHRVDGFETDIIEVYGQFKKGPLSGRILGFLLEIEDILTARLLEDGLIEVTFEDSYVDPNGLTVHEIVSGKCGFVDLSDALGWHPDGQENEHIPVLTCQREEVDKTEKIDQPNNVIQLDAWRRNPDAAS